MSYRLRNTDNILLRKFRKAYKIDIDVESVEVDNSVPRLEFTEADFLMKMGITNIMMMNQNLGITLLINCRKLS